MFYSLGVSAVRTIVHLTMPCFYALVEQRLRPALVGTPVIVTGKRWVLDASPEARVRGIEPGMSRPHARRICPEAERIDFAADRYTSHAQRIWDLLAEHTLIIQPLHSHEAFCDLSGCPQPLKAVSEIVERLEMGRTRAVLGVASCKLIARAVTRSLERRLSFEDAASWVERRSFDTREEEQVYLENLPISYLWPLSSQVLDRLRHLGLRRVGDLLRVPQRDLTRQFGVAEAERLRRYAEGRDSERVLALYPPPCLIESLAPEGALVDEASVRFCLECLAARVSRQLKTRGEGCRWLDLKLSLSGNRSAEGSVSLPHAYHEEEELKLAFWRAFRRCRVAEPVERLQVTARDLQPLSGLQLGLFQQGSVERRRSLERVFETLRERFGQQSLDYGRQRFPAITTRRERFLAQLLSDWNR